MTDPLVLVDRVGATATVTLNRPAQYNALSHAMLDALGATLADLAAEPDLRCVILAGAGRAFCSGHDLREMQAIETDQAALCTLFATCSGVMLALRDLPVPVIARVQGPAVAAGCQLVAACDLAVAAQGATFAVSGINLGLFCSTPAVPLTRAVAPKAAFDMLVTGRTVGAVEALAIGLVNRVVPDAEIEAATGALAAEICAKSPAAVRIGKRLLREQDGLPLEAAYRQAGAAMAANMREEDARQGIGAFLDRRGRR